MTNSKSNNGTLEVEIRPRKDWRLLFNSLIVGIWGAFFYASLIGFNNRTHIGRNTAQGVAIVLFTLAGLLWASYLLLKALFYYEMISADPVYLTIRGRLLLIEMRESQYDNSSVSNLRYEEWSGGRSGTQNGIRFEWKGQTVTFAHQADASASWEVIDHLKEIYPYSTPSITSSPAVTSW